MGQLCTPHTVPHNSKLAWALDIVDPTLYTNVNIKPESFSLYPWAHSSRKQFRCHLVIAVKRFALKYRIPLKNIALSVSSPGSYVDVWNFEPNMWIGQQKSNGNKHVHQLGYHNTHLSMYSEALVCNYKPFPSMLWSFIFCLGYG